MDSFVIEDDGSPVGTIEDGDSVLFFNFRGDRAIELSIAFEKEDLKELSRKFIIKELTFDPSNANYLIQNIQTWANFECVEFTQSPAMISEPMQELEARIYSNTLRFNGDAMMTWQMSNVVKKQARGGGEVKHYFPTKQSAGNKIDIVVAMVMALGRLMTYEDTGGAYEGRANNDSTPMLRIL